MSCQGVYFKFWMSGWYSTFYLWKIVSLDQWSNRQYNKGAECRVQQQIDGLFVLETRPKLSSSRLGGVGSTRRHQHCELWNEFFCLDVSAAVTGVKDAPVFGSTRRLWVRGQTSPNPQSPTLGHELSGTVASYYTLHIMVANIFLLRKKRESTLKMMEKSQDL